MLTKKHLQFSTRKGSVYPKFIKEEIKYTSFIEECLQVYKRAEGMTAEELAEEVNPIADAAPIPGLVAKGFLKLLDDRLEYATVSDSINPAFREDFFKKSFVLHSKLWGHWEPLEKKLQKIKPKESLYADLPQYAKVKKFKKISASALINRYNVAQVQGLFYQCHSLKVFFPSPSQEELRGLYRALRFHQLLASLVKKEDGLELEIGGPLSIFGQAKKYSLKLSLFFPFLLTCHRWQLQAEVEPVKNKRLTLDIKTPTQLNPIHTHFNTYIPEEFVLFMKNFESLETPWQISLAQEAIVLKGESHATPDFLFRHKNTGKTIFLEVFHQWHKAQFETRLQQLKEIGYPDLICGYSKAVEKELDVKKVLGGSLELQSRVFSFREVPTKTQVHKILKSLTI